MKSLTQKTIGLLVSLFTIGITVHAQQIGEIYQGGYIFQINEDGTGLVAAMEDLEGTYEWGCYGEIVNGADGQAIGTGYQNTLDIVNQGCTTESGGVTAAQAALDAEINGYGDWYLPSKDELKEIYNTLGNGGSDGNIGGFDISFYWSSTEYFNNFTAWFVSFNNGYTGYYNGLLTLKYNTNRVRVIRSVTFGQEMVYTECGPDEYESMAPTSSTDRECSALSICSADEYELVPATATSDRICETIVEGCMDATAYNYDANANTDDGSCNALSLPKGWSMFGYTCLEAKDVVAAFEGHKDQIEIIKDEWGLAYLPSYEFNALGDLIYMEGYQIKVDEALVGLKFCDMITPEDGVSQADVDSVQALLDAIVPEDGITQADVDAAHAMYEGWCASDLDNDAICDADEVSGCMDETACNYVSAAEFDDGSCYNNDLGCGCDQPEAQEGYDCEGNEIPLYQVGDFAQGGMVFYVDETGQHGLIAATEDLPGTYEWGCQGVIVNGADEASIGTGYQNTLDIVNQGCTTESGGVTAAQAALDAEINGYGDWYLPSKDELKEIYNTLGNGGSDGNIGGFGDFRYWSSSEYNNNYAWFVVLSNGYTDRGLLKSYAGRVRVIRAF